MSKHASSENEETRNPRLPAMIKLGCTGVDHVKCLTIKVTDLRSGLEYIPVGLIGGESNGDVADGSGSRGEIVGRGEVSHTVEELYEFHLSVHSAGGPVICHQAPPPAPPGTMICTVSSGSGQLDSIDE